MKIAIIVKTAITDSKVYTVHKNKVTYHTNNLFLSQTDKAAIEFALSWIEKNGGTVDAYTFEEGILADRVLHEALAMGVDNAIKFSGVDINDPLQENYITNHFINYIQKNKKDYDLILSGYNTNSDMLSAYIAQKLDYFYYDYVSAIDTNFNYESSLEKGKIRGQYKLPAVISVLDTINNPHLPSFVKLHNALTTPITDIKVKKNNNDDESQIIANQKKHKKIIFDMNKDPNSVQELVDLLKDDGILK